VKGEWEVVTPYVIVGCTVGGGKNIAVDGDDVNYVRYAGTVIDVVVCHCFYRDVKGREVIF
jgi:hypothetical protein